MVTVVVRRVTSCTRFTVTPRGIQAARRFSNLDIAALFRLGTIAQPSSFSLSGINPQKAEDVADLLLSADLLPCQFTSAAAIRCSNPTKSAPQPNLNLRIWLSHDGSGGVPPLQQAGLYHSWLSRPSRHGSRRLLIGQPSYTPEVSLPTSTVSQ